MDIDQTTEEFVDGLSNALYSFSNSGLIKGSDIWDIDYILTFIYQDAHIKYLKENDIYDPEDQDEIPNTAYELFRFVDNQEQFLQDYKNIINEFLFLKITDFDIKQVSKKIIGLRSK